MNFSFLSVLLLINTDHHHYYWKIDIPNTWPFTELSLYIRGWAWVLVTCSIAKTSSCQCVLDSDSFCLMTHDSGLTIFQFLLWQNFGTYLLTVNIQIRTLFLSIQSNGEKNDKKENWIKLPCRNWVISLQLGLTFIGPF